jgi:hypothetical protein
MLDIVLVIKLEIHYFIFAGILQLFLRARVASSPEITCNKFSATRLSPSVTRCKIFEFKELSSVAS